jgi:hypothetical protein
MDRSAMARRTVEIATDNDTKPIGRFFPATPGDEIPPLCGGSPPEWLDELLPSGGDEKFG